jgi:hypothetical protein
MQGVGNFLIRCASEKIYFLWICQKIKLKTPLQNGVAQPGGFFHTTIILASKYIVMMYFDFAAKAA